MSIASIPPFSCTPCYRCTTAGFLTPGEEPLDLGTGVLLAIYHDAAEILTGDLPTPVKYFSAEISEAYKAVEAASCQSLLDLLPADLREDYAPYLLPAGAYDRYLPYLKAADPLLRPGEVHGGDPAGQF